MLKPFPTELQNTINPEPSGRSATVESLRNLFCNHYDGCLDEAVKKGWNSFTCVRCPMYTVGNQDLQEQGLEAYATQRRMV